MADSASKRKRKRDDSAGEGNGENSTASVSIEKKEKIETNADVKEEEDPAGGGEADVDEDEDIPTAEYLSRNCPYLDTINRNILDFDFEKLCSVTMSNCNVYACLVCGKYFQGRGLDTQAHTHSLMTGHHVYINLHTLKFYCLPDNYEIKDNSLEDIRYYLQPTFAKDLVKTFDVDQALEKSRALDGRAYIPGIVGLNNIKANDYVNSTVQILCRVTPFRNFFLDENNYKSITNDPLVATFGELIRKVWNPRNFKSHVSPHEFLQAVVNASGRKFRITEQSDPFAFLSWLLNTLHLKLKVKKRSIVHDIFRGKLKISTKKLPPSKKDGEDEVDVDDKPEYQEKTDTSKFLILPLDVPPPPLFTDEREQNIIPQVPLFELLNKFDGVTEKEYQTSQDLFKKRFEVTELPQYLIVHVKRFTKNTFFTEKNPTIVNFPVKNLVLKDYVAGNDDTTLFKYDLVANIVHEGLAGAGKGTYAAQCLHKGVNQWFSTQDLHVDEILPQMITLSTSYIQIWERQADTAEEIEMMQKMKAEQDAIMAETEAKAKEDDTPMDTTDTPPVVRRQGGTAPPGING